MVSAKKASFHRVPIPLLCYPLPEILLFSADPNPILLSRLCPTGRHVLWGCCVCVDHHDYLCVPEAGGTAILIALVPSPLPGTEQVGINCLWTALLSYCFTLPFFLNTNFWIQFSLVSIVVPNTRLNLINFPTCKSRFASPWR